MVCLQSAFSWLSSIQLKGLMLCPSAAKAQNQQHLPWKILPLGLKINQDSPNCYSKKYCKHVFPDLALLFFPLSVRYLWVWSILKVFAFSFFPYEVTSVSKEHKETRDQAAVTNTSSDLTRMNKGWRDGSMGKALANMCEFWVWILRALIILDTVFICYHSVSTTRREKEGELLQFKGQPAWGI